MPQSSFLKRVSGSKPNPVERTPSPYDFDLDRCMAIEVMGFEEVEGQAVLSGRNMATGEEVRMSRAQSRRSRRAKENPLGVAAQRVSKGGVMLFTDVSRVEGSENDWTSGGFMTITDGRAEFEPSVYLGQAVFLDAVTGYGADGDASRVHQVYNVINRSESRLVSTEAEFRSTFVGLIEEMDRDDDSLILRGYSANDRIATSIRIFCDPSESAKSRLATFVDQTHFLSNVGSEEGTFEATGADILATLADESDDTIWELIPVSGIRKYVVAPRDPVKSERLQASAHALYQDFVVEKGAAMPAFRRGTLGVQTAQRQDGQIMENVKAICHEAGEPLPLAVVDTPHASNLLDIIPRIVADPSLYKQTGNYDAPFFLQREDASVEIEASSDVAEITPKPITPSDSPIEAEDTVTKASATAEPEVEDPAPELVTAAAPEANAEEKVAQVAVAEPEDEGDEFDFLSDDFVPGEENDPALNETPSEAVEIAKSEPEASQIPEADGEEEEVLVDLDALEDVSIEEEFAEVTPAVESKPTEAKTEAAAPEVESEPVVESNDGVTDVQEEVLVDLDALDEDEEPQPEVMIDLDALDADAANEDTAASSTAEPVPAAAPNPQPTSAEAPVEKEVSEDRNEESVALFDGDEESEDFDISSIFNDTSPEPEAVEAEPEDTPSEEISSVASETPDDPEKEEESEFSAEDFAAIGAAIM